MIVKTMNMKESVIVLFVMVFIALTCCDYAEAANKSGASIRIKAAKAVGNEFHKALKAKPVITLAGKDKTILILESMRFSSEFVWQITLNNKNIPFCGNVYDIIVNAKFKKVYFIKQRYNENEFAGEIWDVERRCLEGNRVGYCGESSP